MLEAKMARILSRHPIGDFDIRSMDDDYMPNDDDSNDDFEYTNDSNFVSGRKKKTGIKIKPMRKERTKTIKKGTRKLVSQTFNNASARQYTKEEMITSPSDERTTFIKFETVIDNIFNPRFLKDRRISSFNTIIPSYNPMSTNIAQYFNLDTTFVPVNLKEISQLTDEELLEELEKTNENINEIPVIDDMFIFAPPYSENLTSSISINADVVKFDWKRLGSINQFDVVIMDPPWFIAGDSATRGVDLDYDLMTDEKIIAMDIPSIQSDGFLFMWVVASHVHIGSNILSKWGYDFIGCLNWVKTTTTNKYAPSNGYYLQHVKETCIIGRKGRNPEGWRPDKFNDVIMERRAVRQSHKPTHLYEIIEEMFPESTYIEVFARPHNLRDGWVSLGLECPP